MKHLAAILMFGMLSAGALAQAPEAEAPASPEVQILQTEPSPAQLPSPESEAAKQPESDKETEAVQETEQEKPVSEFPSINKLQEILLLLKNRYPQTAAKIDKPDADLINAAIAKISPGIQFSMEKSAEEQDSAPDAEPQYFPPIIVSSQKIIYVRIDGFSPEIFKSLKEDLESVMRLKNTPRGAVLDLRNASSGRKNYADALMALSLFVPSKLLPTQEGVEYPAEVVRKLPIMLLTGEKTCGASEVFAYIMLKEKYCVSFGQETAGRPCRQIEVALENGGYLRMPDFPANIAAMPYAPVKPSIQAPVCPQIDYKDISGQLDAEKGDSTLENAIEIILCVEGLHAEKKNSSEKDPADPVK